MPYNSRPFMQSSPVMPIETEPHRCQSHASFTRYRVAGRKNTADTNIQRSTNERTQRTQPYSTYRVGVVHSINLETNVVEFDEIESFDVMETDLTETGPLVFQCLVRPASALVEESFEDNVPLCTPMGDNRWISKAHTSPSFNLAGHSHLTLLDALAKQYQHDVAYKYEELLESTGSTDKSWAVSDTRLHRTDS